MPVLLNKERTESLDSFMYQYETATTNLLRNKTTYIHISLQI